MKGDRTTLVHGLPDDPSDVATVLDGLLASGSQKELLQAVRQVAIANGGIAKVATDANLNGTSIYRTLSERGNPDLRNLTLILRAMNLRLSIQPIVTA